MKKHIFPLCLLIITTLSVACKSDSSQLRESAEIEMSKYIVENNIPDSIISSTGLILTHTKVGKGDSAKRLDKVYIRYRLTSLKDSVLRENMLNFYPYSFTVYGSYFSTYNAVPGNFKGLHEGLLSMRKGGKARMVLPYRLAQGANGINTIPDYANLILEVYLTDID